MSVQALPVASRSCRMTPRRSPRRATFACRQRASRSSTRPESCLVWTRRRLGSRLRTVEEGFVRQDRLESWPGRAYPLGATFDGVGTNFAVYSEVGTEVRLCLFDESGQERVVPLIERNAFVWHAYLPGVLPGQRYGYRVAGPYDLDRGLRFNAAKLLLDPYAYAVEGEVEWNDAVFAHAHDDPDGPPNEQDSAP